MRVIGGKLRSFSIGYIGHREGRSLPREFTRPEAVTLSREERESLHEWSALGPEILKGIVDKFGHPRLSVARDYFLPLTQDMLELLKKVFVFWQSYAEYMLLMGENVQTGETLRLAVKCSKRGNDVFARRLDRKLGFFKAVENVKLFTVNEAYAGTAETNLLWVTLTYDSKRCSLDDAWLNCMDEFNKFITNLRNKYGKIDVLKFPQPFDDSNGEAYGYPHYHLILLFHEATFKVVPRLEQNNDGEWSLVYRIEQKDEFKSQGKWHSFSDVKALSSVGAVVNYCRKYAQNVCYGSSDKAILTAGVLWLYRKQTFSMSSGFRENFAEFIRAMHDSKTSNMQKTLDGEEFLVWVWRYYGIRSALDVGAKGEWVVSLNADQFQRLIDDHG